MPRKYGTTNAIPYSAAPAVGLTGDMYYDSTAKTVYVSDGTTWNLCVGVNTITANELNTFAVTSTKINANAVIMSKIVAAAGSPATIARIASGAGNYSEIAGAPVVICTSSTRPATPSAGMTIFETDTYKTLQYTTATTGWQKPWGEPWGVLYHSPLTTATSAVTTTEIDLWNSGAITYVANRYIAIVAHYFMAFLNSGGWVRYKVDGSFPSGVNNSILRVQSLPASTLLHGEAMATLTAGSHTITLTAAAIGTSATTVLQGDQIQGYWEIRDMGPSANPA